MIIDKKAIENIDALVTAYTKPVGTLEIVNDVYEGWRIWSEFGVGPSQLLDIK